MNKILVEVSVGELLDKISILEIKKDRIKDSNKLKFINEEYEVLKKELEKNNFNYPYSHPFFSSNLLMLQYLQVLIYRHFLF